nr:hypothetical protein [Tanacetum cinerariifolium]
MEDSDITMKEYVRYEAEKALRNDKDNGEDKLGIEQSSRDKYHYVSIRRIQLNGYGVSTVPEVLNVIDEGGVIIEHLAKHGGKNVFGSINDEVRESLLNLKNTMYHSRQIRYFPRLRQDQDHFLTLMNMPYPHQIIRRIRYFGQHSKETRSTANTPYPEDPVRRIQ